MDRSVLISQHPPSVTVDQRIVVLLKSLRTNNRFYTLVEQTRGLKNADTIEDFPPDLTLGIAYPCLEDGLNDFAVIRTTFETIDLFRDDEDLRNEMMSIIDETRVKLALRLSELRDLIVSGQAIFLGTDLREFHDYITQMATRGTIRRQLDSMMKVDVFESVAQAEAALSGAGMAEPMYRYELLAGYSLEQIAPLSPREFIGRVFDDILEAVHDGENYQGKYTFDRNVFQKFIAVMFVNYATTDPMFYGTSREDYGVSSDKDMQDTPLYQAVAKALRLLEQELRGGAAPAPETEDLSHIFGEPGDLPDFLEALQGRAHTVEIPTGAAEQLLLEPLAQLATAVRLLELVDDPAAIDVRQLVLESGRHLFRNLQKLDILSPLAADPLGESQDG